MSGPATVAHLLPSHNPFPPVYPAGTELRVEQVARRQRRYRAVVICAAFDDQSERERLDAMEVRRIRIGRLYRRLFQKITRLDPVSYTDRMWRIIEEEKATLLHIHNEPKLLAGLAKHLTRRERSVVVHVANEKPIPNDATFHVTHWVACSEYVARWLRDANGISGGNISVIYTGVDIAARPAQSSLSAGERRERRARYGVDNDRTLVFLFAGRLVREKGLAELLDAFALATPRLDRPAVLLVAGNVRESDDPRNEKAVYGRAMVERIRKTTNVHWVGSLHPNAMHDFLLAGDVFVLPSLWHDPFPTVMVEAAAAGLPIIGSERGGISEFLRHYPGAPLLATPEDPTIVARELERYGRDDRLRLQAGAWLRARVEQHFDWSRVTAEFELLYDKLR